ncbi:hypothetical protein BDQ17DRAFT_1358248, partial [Cyathus striatus]
MVRVGMLLALVGMVRLLPVLADMVRVGMPLALVDMVRLLPVLADMPADIVLVLEVAMEQPAVVSSGLALEAVIVNLQVKLTAPLLGLLQVRPRIPPRRSISLGMVQIRVLEAMAPIPTQLQVLPK